MPPAHAHAVRVQRLERHPDPLQVPRALERPGRFEVDGTWGTVQPLQLAAGVRTLGERELIAHIEQGLPLVDTRLPHFFEQGTIPGARNIPHEDVLDRLDELDRTQPTAFFCNGPQCTATPSAVRALLGAGYPPAAILYYRGGMHDWVTLGYPVA